MLNNNAVNYFLKEKQMCINVDFTKYEVLLALTYSQQVCPKFYQGKQRHKPKYKTHTSNSFKNWSKKKMFLIAAVLMVVLHKTMKHLKQMLLVFLYNLSQNHTSFKHCKCLICNFSTQLLIPFCTK